MLTSVFPAISETFVVDHVIGLARSGWDVTLAAWHIDADLLASLRRERNLGVHVEELNRTVSASRPRRIATILRRLLPIYPRGILSPWLRDQTLASQAVSELAQQAQPDVIHAHFGPNGLAAAFAARRLRIPLLVDFHGYDVTVVPKQHGWVPYRKILAHAQAIVHSSFVEQRVQRHVGIPTHRVTLGVDMSLFKVPPRKRQWPKHIRLLTVGRLIWLKGHHVVLEALALLRHRLPQHDFSLRICGEGPLQGLLQERAHMLGIAAQVRIVGGLPHSEVAKEMRQADILLIPSVPVESGAQEAFCRVAVEGMATGLAVIGTDTGGLAETIGEGGEVVRAGSAPALADAVARMLRDASPAALARRAKTRAAEFPNERMWQQYDEIARQAHSG